VTIAASGPGPRRLKTCRGPVHDAYKKLVARAVRNQVRRHAFSDPQEIFALRRENDPIAVTPCD
jgi:hypothetical protein